MTTCLVELDFLAVMNLETLVSERMKEIERLAAKHPTLPMKDPQTWACYERAVAALRKAANEKLEATQR